MSNTKILPKSILMLSCALLNASFLGASSIDTYADGLDNVVSFHLQENGKLGAICTYGEVEKDVNPKDVFEGKVCASGTVAQKVKFYRLEMDGGLCRAKRMRVPVGLDDLFVSFSGYRVSEGKASSMCDVGLGFNVPPGYRIGVSKFITEAYITEKIEGDVSFSISGDSTTDQPSKTETTSGRGSLKIQHSFEFPIFSDCSKGYDLMTKLALFSHATVKGGRVAKGEWVHVSRVTLQDVIVEKCK